MLMKNNKLGYVSLFSSAGVGCYGVKLEGFECIATSELIKRRLDVQKMNNVCSKESGYVCGDITNAQVKEAIFTSVEDWKKENDRVDFDLLIATPPCQGISVANHKKNNELKRNSLVVESIIIVSKFKPRYFIFENVRGFLKTTCTDVDGSDKLIEDAINENLAGNYNIAHKVINFKDYGNNSSRTRTLVIGVRKDIEGVSPSSLFPERTNAPSLRELIGSLPRLKEMGEISKDDFYHSFRNYDKRMLLWILNTKQGQSAFQNERLEHMPHKVINGKIVVNQNKNGDKYKRCHWDKVAPCVHTRNDILASQSTIHPEDPRVFSIRELMLFMGVPNSFRWTEYSLDTLNSMKLDKKKEMLAKNEINIRQCLGEAVPTPIFQRIAQKIKQANCNDELSVNIIKRLIEKEKLSITDNLVNYLQTNKIDFVAATKIAELANSKRLNDAAYYTRQDLCFSLVSTLPDLKKKSISILEPSVGVGNFLPALFWKYSEAQEVRLDLLDINGDSIKILKQILKTVKIPKNFEIRFVHDDFLTHKFRKKYDIIIGNPPFGRIDSTKYASYTKGGLKPTIKSKNIFALFFEKALGLSNIVALFTPKSILNAPEFADLRNLLNTKSIVAINDYGEKGFKGVKIETVSLVIDSKSNGSKTAVNSYLTNSYKIYPQGYITDPNVPYWLIYRNHHFDKTLSRINVGFFTVLRDRTLTRKDMLKKGKIRVIKSRNIANGNIVKSDQDLFVEDASITPLSNLYFKKHALYVAPNLSYYPRLAPLPAGSLVDGSAAILIPKDKNKMNDKILPFFCSKEFYFFYRVARNYNTRSLNIDKLSVFFWGPPKTKYDFTPLDSSSRSSMLFWGLDDFMASNVQEST